MPKRFLIALLRGINVTGKRKVPMAELRSIATKLGYEDVTTYIQSGNLLFKTADAPSDVETALERAIEKRFGFFVDVAVRTAPAWNKYLASCPFPDAAEERPNLLHLALAKRRVKKGALDELLRYAKAGERIVALKDALWIDYPAGAGTTKITPAVLDRLAGCPVTARNLRTVRELAELTKSPRPSP